MNPKQAPIPNTKKNKASGKRAPAPLFPIAPGFESSFSAKIINISIALATDSLNNMPRLVIKACGYVQKMPAVALAAGGTVRTSLPSKALIPLM